jgi:hypothetical protein
MGLETINDLLGMAKMLGLWGNIYKAIKKWNDVR